MQTSSGGGAATPEPTHPLQLPKFRAYLVARFVTVLAQQGMVLIIAWQAYNIARATMSAPAAAAQLGMIGLIQFVVLFALTPFSGLIADQFDRRRIGQLAMCVQLCVALTLAAGSMGGWISLPIIFTIAGIMGAARAFLGPSLGSLTANIVPLPLMPRAIALGSIGFQTGTVVGPAIAGYAYAAQPHYAYLASALMFLIGLVGLFLVGKVQQAPPDRTRHPLRQIVDGLAYVRQNRLVQATITLDLCAVLLAGATALLPVYAREILHVGSRGLGHLAAAPGIGAALMAFYFSVWPMKHNVGIKMLGAVIIFGLATICFGATAFLPDAFRMPVALASMVVWGAADMVSVFVRQSLVQIHTPDAMRGRVGSVSQLTISASNELGEAESGFLAALIGPVAAVISGGVGAILITLIWFKIYPELRLARSFDPSDLPPHKDQPQGAAP
jgi:MFS family permease